MSPEQAQGKRATKKSDLYSLGAVMYVMLTGRPPFRGKTTLDVIQQQKFGQFDRPCRIVPEIPHWLDDIVVQLLEKDPDKRFADAYVLMRRLQEVVSKVELSREDQTEATGDVEGTAPTVALGSQSGGQVGGTLMRDLVKAELQNAQRASPIGELFNNTWVLVTMLLLLIAGGVAWFSRSAEKTPVVAERQNADSVKLNKYFRFSDGPVGDATAFMSRAVQDVMAGRLAEAEQTRAALKLVHGTDEKHAEVRNDADALLELVRKRREDRIGGAGLLHEAMDRADRLAATDVKAARGIWESVIELYGSNPDAQTEVETAKSKLKQFNAEAPSVGKN
jgi:serine/threonine-protein kinase